MIEVDAAPSFRELEILRRVELEARAYARHSHGNLNGTAYRAREEARDRLLDALAELDAVRDALDVIRCSDPR